jgi:hypothetical protein
MDFWRDHMVSAEGNSGSVLPSNWSTLTPEQKRQWRLNSYLDPSNIKFVSDGAKKAYQTRARRMVDVYNLREPDRVPVILQIGELPYTLNGVSVRTAWYDYVQAVDACRKFNEKYSSALEYYASPAFIPGRIMEMLDYKIYYWPGHGLPLTADVHQFIEGEYMRADEYDDFTRDPSDYFNRTYFPRILGAFEPFRTFQPSTDMIEIVSIAQFDRLADPRMQESLIKMLEVGREYQRYKEITGPHRDLEVASGFPATAFGRLFAKAPFDTLGDTLRGTAPLMKDIYRRPDKVLEACDKIADLTISSVLKSSKQAHDIIVSYPLHKGADGWMSQKQFETLYWPSLKKVMNAFINEGYIQSLFAEGAYNTRLEYFNEFPKGSVTLRFDQTDMAKAKQIVGHNCCIQGNVPSSLTVTGSYQEVKDYCRGLIEQCGKGGGYILTVGCGAPNPRLENMQAMMDAVRDFGIYKK